MSKTISVPIDQQAAYDLDYNIAKKEQLVEMELTDSEFNTLWNEGIFSMIDKIASCTIDEFEDEHITDLAVINEILNELKKSKADLRDLIKMFELAIAYKTSIHFYF
jgi:hypothetical protein